MTLLSLAIDLLQLAASDKGKRCCAHTDGESVCVMPEGHKAEHVMERADSIVPFG